MEAHWQVAEKPRAPRDNVDRVRERGTRLQSAILRDPPGCPRGEGAVSQPADTESNTKARFAANAEKLTSALRLVGRENQQRLENEPQIGHSKAFNAV